MGDFSFSQTTERTWRRAFVPERALQVPAGFHDQEGFIPEMQPWFKNTSQLIKSKYTEQIKIPQTAHRVTQI